MLILFIIRFHEEPSSLMLGTQREALGMRLIREILMNWRLGIHPCAKHTVFCQFTIKFGIFKPCFSSDIKP